MSEPGAIYAIGGHEDKDGEREILRAVAESLGGRGIAIAAIASRAPQQYVEAYTAAFGALGVDDVVELAVPKRAASSDPAVLAVLDRVGGVFLTGGKQHRLLKRVLGTPLETRLWSFWEAGGVLAGTSAGASALGERAIEPHGTEQGLGYIPGSIIDQHFNQRGRQSRLGDAVRDDGSRVGYGIDEDTALEVRGGVPVRVLGTGVITVMQPGGAVEVLRPGRLTGAARP